ncbi:pyrimidine reductase family protein [Tessaracoccus antarcticus]|uniref:Pyrimidine reductase family protein n=1 Tax=Tessaracoccus antarcticus TaxID=2479848 RepID=A0A3M0GFT7_9ACTN|nr:pyrimidine reductase family protein [Tessaracoccus antarcticus]RMB61562.1 pyrimidine reductase family protein [Tessaracoccus antarcticus]
MTTRIDRLWPTPDDDLDDDALLEAYAFPAERLWLRMNFVSSIDGAATSDGRSGGLGDDADHRVFDLQRRAADAVLVGAGTARQEGYAAMRLGEEAVAWRVARGMPPHPVFVLVTRRLDLDPDSPIFTDAPVRPIIYTVAEAPPGRRTALAAVAHVVDAGESDLDPLRVRDDLATRGLLHVQAEGGPSLFGAFLAAGAVDELCLTLAPTVVAGDAGRIARTQRPAPTGMGLVGVLRADDELLLRYTRAAPRGA